VISAKSGAEARSRSSFDSAELRRCRATLWIDHRQSHRLLAFAQIAPRQIRRYDVSKSVLSVQFFIDWFDAGDLARLFAVAAIDPES
jgi:hypothetical protein